MPEISLTYTTKTKTSYGLEKQLIKMYKESFGIPSTTRIYNLDNNNNKLDFDIEKPNKGRGIIKYYADYSRPEKVNGMNLIVVFDYLPQDVSR